MLSHLFKCNHPTHISTFQSPHLFPIIVIAKSSIPMGVCVCICCCGPLETNRISEIQTCMHCTLLLITIKTQSPNWISLISLFPSIHVPSAYKRSIYALHSPDSHHRQTVQVKNTTNQLFLLFHLIRRNDIHALSMHLIGTFQASHRWSLLVIIRKTALIIPRLGSENRFKCAGCVDFSCTSHIYTYHIIYLNGCFLLLL